MPDGSRFVPQAYSEPIGTSPIAQGLKGQDVRNAEGKEAARKAELKKKAEEALEKIKEHWAEAKKKEEVEEMLKASKPNRLDNIE